VVVTVPSAEVVVVVPFVETTVVEVDPSGDVV